MLEHAFAAVSRVIFVIGAGNRRSQRAVEKFGAVRSSTMSSDKGELWVYELTAQIFTKP